MLQLGKKRQYRQVCVRVCVCVFVSKMHTELFHVNVDNVCTAAKLIAELHVHTERVQQRESSAESCYCPSYTVNLILIHLNSVLC